jgi:hypothetical protein
MDIHNLLFTVFMIVSNLAWFGLLGFLMRIKTGHDHELGLFLIFPGGVVIAYDLILITHLITHS